MNINLFTKTKNFNITAKLERVKNLKLNSEGKIFNVFAQFVEYVKSLKQNNISK